MQNANKNEKKNDFIKQYLLFNIKIVNSFPIFYVYIIFFIMSRLYEKYEMCARELKNKI